MQGDDKDRPDQLIIETMGDGLILSDLETDLVVEANRAAAMMHGYAPAEIVGQKLISFMTAADHAGMFEWTAAVQAGHLCDATAIHVRRDGTPFAVEVRRVTCNHLGRPCLLSVIRDVSPKVEASTSSEPPEGARRSEQTAHIEEAMSRAALEERKRLAQNLHDAVNQSLFSASLIAEVLPRLWERHPEQVRESLEDLRRLTRGALAEMRGLLVELQPLVLTDSDMDDLLRLLADAFAGRTNIPAIVTVSGKGTLPADVQSMFYRVCQETLNNVAKHSDAGQVDIHLEYADGAVELSIRDDGRGFDPEAVPSGHYGLSIMHERASACGAELLVTSQPGHGSEIIVRWTAAAEPNAS